MLGSVKLFLWISLAPTMAFGSSCNPWSVKIVYPQPTKRIVVKRHKTPRFYPKPRPKPEEQAPISFVRCKFSFISGSAEKPKHDDFKAWKESQPKESREREADSQDARQTILDALDGRLPPPPREKPVELDDEVE